MTKLRLKDRKPYADDEERRPRRQWPGYQQPGTREVTHTFPDEVVRVKVTDVKKPMPLALRLKKPSVVGVVEHGGRKDRKLAAGYMVLETRDMNFVRLYPSPSEPLYIYYLNTGFLSEKPEKTDLNGGYVEFGNYPEPKYHWSFRTPSDVTDESACFEAHCTNVVKARALEMSMKGVKYDEIKRYVTEAKEFLHLCEELFRKHGKI
ncbi:MAG: hypothetical protein QXD77_02580 [Candidatus Aenigmatarchaeota archaeon]